MHTNYVSFSLKRIDIRYELNTLLHEYRGRQFTGDVSECNFGQKKKLFKFHWKFSCGDNRHHDDVIKWKHFPRYWPFVRGIHRSPVNSPHKGQWCGALMFSLICVWINGGVNNREAGDLGRYRAHYDVTVMIKSTLAQTITGRRTSDKLLSEPMMTKFTDVYIHYRAVMI